MKKFLLFLMVFFLLLSFCACGKGSETLGKVSSINPGVDMVRVVIYDEIYIDDIAQQSALSVEKAGTTTTYIFTKDGYTELLSEMYKKTEIMLKNSYSEQVRSIMINDDISGIRLFISYHDFKESEKTIQNATDIIGIQALKYQIYKNGGNAKLSIAYVNEATNEILYEDVFSA